MMGRTELKAEVRLKFRAFNDRPVIAMRRSMLSLSQRGPKFESLEQVLKTRDEDGEMIEVNHQCVEM